MELDMTTLTATAAAKVWEDLNGGAAAPLDEQDAMLQYSVEAKVLPVIITVIPSVERAVKDKLASIIDQGYSMNWGPDEILMALTVELSEDE
jgi:hypothetical protein